MISPILSPLTLVVQRSHQCFLKLRKTESLREADFGQRISKLSTKTKSKKEILLLLGGFLRMSRY